jgi:hypothetical protein
MFIDSLLRHNVKYTMMRSMLLYVLLLTRYDSTVSWSFLAQVSGDYHWYSERSACGPHSDDYSPVWCAAVRQNNAKCNSRRLSIDSFELDTAAIYSNRKTIRSHSHFLETFTLIILVVITQTLKVNTCNINVSISQTQLDPRPSPPTIHGGRS